MNCKNGIESGAVKRDSEKNLHLEAGRHAQNRMVDKNGTRGL